MLARLTYHVALMEARDEPGRIRPLPPELPEFAASDGSPPPPPDRRWVPIAVAGGALVFFGLLAGLFGASTDTGVEAGGARLPSDTTLPGLRGDSPATTTTTAAPPTLRQMASVLERPLRIIYRDREGATTSRVTWDLDSPVASDLVTSGAAATAASYDASHQQLLWITEGENETLWLGEPPSAEPVFVDVAGAHWHPTLARTLAWVGTPPAAGLPHLYRATSLATTGLEGLVDIGPVPVGSELIGWGDWGFALRVPVPVSLRQWAVPDRSGDGSTVFQLLEFTLVVDPLGAQASAAAGSPLAVGPKGSIIVRPANDAFEAAVAAGFSAGDIGIEVPLTRVETGASGEPIVLVGPALGPTAVAFDAPAPVMNFLFSSSGSHVTAMGEFEGRYTITTRATDGSLRRITSVDNVDAAIGFSRDGALLILHNRDNGDIVFHDWNGGASFRVPFSAGRVLVVDA